MPTQISVKHIEDLGWTDLDTMIQEENKSWRVLAGETNWGGTGFILLQDLKNDIVKWVIHLSTMNNPKKVQIENDVVRVTTDLNFPSGVDFIVPLSDPKNFKTEQANGIEFVLK